MNLRTQSSRRDSITWMVRFGLLASLLAAPSLATEVVIYHDDNPSPRGWLPPRTTFTSSLSWAGSGHLARDVWDDGRVAEEGTGKSHPLFLAGAQFARGVSEPVTPSGAPPIDKPLLTNCSPRYSQYPGDGSRAPTGRCLLPSASVLRPCGRCDRRSSDSPVSIALASAC